MSTIFCAVCLAYIVGKGKVRHKCGGEVGRTQAFSCETPYLQRQMLLVILFRDKFGAEGLAFANLEERQVTQCTDETNEN